MAEDTTRELLVRVSATTELLRSQLTAAEREIDGFAKKASAANDNIDRSFKRGAVSAGQMRFAMRDLSMQIGDVATQFSLGQRPMQIFASQGTQIAGAIGLMAGEATALGRFLGGPWFQILTSAALVMAPFISRLFDTADAAKTAKDATDDLTEALGKIGSGKSAEALGTLRVNLEKAESRLRNLQSSPIPVGQGEAGRASAAVAAENRQRQIDDARRAVQEARSNFGIAQLRARQEAEQDAKARASENRTRRAGASRVSRPRAVSANDPNQNAIDALVTDNNRDLFRASEERIRLINKANEEQWNAQSKAIRQQAEYEYDQRLQVQERLQQIEQAKLQTLSGLYESLFRGGTRAIWDDFGNIGRRVLSQVLAQFTLSLFKKGGSSGGFDLGSAIGSAFSSILGFADGGRPPIGRVSMVGERGPELFVPDVAGTIIPNHALGGGGPQIIINAPGATAETVSLIRREILNAAPAIAAAATGQTTRVLNRRTL